MKIKSPNEEAFDKLRQERIEIINTVPMSFDNPEAVLEYVIRMRDNLDTVLECLGYDPDTLEEKERGDPQ